MSYEPLGDHEVEVGRLGRVRLPRVRAVASATTIGVLLGAAVVPVVADPRPQPPTAVPAGERCAPLWQCSGRGEDSREVGDAGSQLSDESSSALADGMASVTADEIAPARSNPTEPVTAKTAEPETVEPATPDATGPIAPTPAEPLAPETAEPLAAETIEPVAPESADPVAPENIETVAPDTAEPVAPDTIEPIAPDVAAPVPPETIEPVAPDTADSVAPDTAEPLPPDAAEPVAPETVEPVAPDTAEPVAPDTAEPVAPEAAEPATGSEQVPGREAGASDDERGWGFSAGFARGWVGGHIGVYGNENRTRYSLGWAGGYDSWWSYSPDMALPDTGLSAELSATARIPGIPGMANPGLGGRATVTLDEDGVTADSQFNRGPVRSGIVAGPEGAQPPETRYGGSVPGFESGRFGASVRVTATMEDSAPPAVDPSKMDSDGDGFTDGSLAESPEVGGRQGMNPAGTHRSDLDRDMDGTPDRSDFMDGPDSDEDGVRDDMDEKPGEVDEDVDSDGVADPFDHDIDTSASDGALATPDSDGDGNSDGSFAESPELGGRGTQDTYGTDQSAPATDASGSDTGTDSGDTPSGAGTTGGDATGTDVTGTDTTDSDATNADASDTDGTGTDTTDSDATDADASDADASDTGTSGSAGPVGSPDSDGDGYSDGSFAESPEMGGRGSAKSYGYDQSSPASEATDADTSDAEASESEAGAGLF
jgi:hypothetical protein